MMHVKPPLAAAWDARKALAAEEHRWWIRQNPKIGALTLVGEPYREQNKYMVKTVCDCGTEGARQLSKLKTAVLNGSYQACRSCATAYAHAQKEPADEAQGL